LGDRIAIMSRGSLRCCGSPLFLKSKYSSGYNLVLTKRQLDSAAANEDESTTNNNNDDKTTNEAHHTTSYETGNRIRNLIQSILPEAALNENLNSEISFVLPSEKTGKFSELFEKLEENKQYLNIDNIGISISTLEDVFLK
jgi:ABC-type multidrug transport system ATPase subunit